MLSGGLLLLAGAFLFVHLLTDARQMVQVLRLKHMTWSGRNIAPTHPNAACVRCGNIQDSLKEAWWEVATFVALIGHLAFDYLG